MLLHNLNFSETFLSFNLFENNLRQLQALPDLVECKLYQNSKTQRTFQNAIFQYKFTLWNIKLKIYI